MIEIMSLIVLIGLTVLILRIWWVSPYRKCAKCGSRCTSLRYKTTSDLDTHRGGAWHVYHHIHCLRCKAETVNEELTFSLPDDL